MKDWLRARFPKEDLPTFERIQWPREKPPAHLTLDDRAVQFTGEFPSVEFVDSFKPWNK